MKRIAVFCGSSMGNNPEYRTAAYQLGKSLGKNNIELVYGGTKIGLMGATADGVLSEKGKAIGILPDFLQQKEIAHPGLTQLILVNTMHERKVKMYELSDAVIALPGGFGTMEEFFEMLTWGQLGLHNKPVGLLNVKGFYDKLDMFLENMVDQGFLNKENKKMIIIEDSINQLLNKFESYQHPDVEKIIREKINKAKQQ
ncbi:MAG: TIGR00730 family Rossman fold protein [Bacteroidota bacterium]